MNLVAVYNRQPAIRSSGLLRSAKPDRFLARFSHKLSKIRPRFDASSFALRYVVVKKRANQRNDTEDLEEFLHWTLLPAANH